MGGSFGDFEPYSRSLVEVVPAEAGGVSVVTAEAVGDIAKAVAAGGGGTETGAVVDHFDADTAVFAARANADEAAAFHGRDAVLDRILGKRLDAHRRDLFVADVVVNIDVHVE